MDVKWLVAALYPRAVAPHENFPVKEVDGAELVGLLADGRFSEFERYLEYLPIQGVGSPERRMLEAIRDSLMDATQFEAIARLKRIRTDGATSAGASCVIALFEVVALCETDRLDESILVLESELDRLRAAPTPHPSTASLFTAALLQQQAMRLAEQGLHQEAIRSAKAAIDALPRGDAEFEHFTLSRGTRQSGRQVHLAIIRALRSCSRSLIVAGEGHRGRGWVGMVRGPETQFQSQQRRALVSAGGSLIDELFESQIGWPSGRRRMAFRDPVDSPLGVALLNAELAGSYGSARAHRVEVGKVRTLRPEGSASWRAAEGLRLFRQAGAREPLDDLIRLLRSQGPLEPLISAGRSALRRTSRGLRPTRCDLAVLNGSADFFDSIELAEAFSVARAFRDRPRLALGEITFQTTLDETTWRVMSRVVPSSGCDDEAAQLLISSILGYPDGALDTQEGAATALVRAVDWSLVRPATLRSWSQWASEQSGGVAAAVARAYLDSSQGAESARTMARPTGLDLAERLLREAAGGSPPAPDELRNVEKVCVEQLEAVRSSAAMGSYGFGGYSAADMACALIEVFDLQSLWSPLTAFLTDPAVGRHEKADALDRLASGRVTIPPAVRRTLSAATDSDLAGRDSDPFVRTTERPSEQLPALVRLRARLGGLSTAERHASIAQLAGSHVPATRVEAVRSIETVLSDEGLRPVSVTLLLQLSYDRDPVVRSEAGRELASMLRPGDGFETVITERLHEMLASDGLLVPLLVLRGLQRLESVPGEFRGSLDRLLSHPARSVRIASQELLDAGD